MCRRICQLLGGPSARQRNPLKLPLECMREVHRWHSRSPCRNRTTGLVRSWPRIRTHCLTPPISSPSSVLMPRGESIPGVRLVEQRTRESRRRRREWQARQDEQSGSNPDLHFNSSHQDHGGFSAVQRRQRRIVQPLGLLGNNSGVLDLYSKYDAPKRNSSSRSSNTFTMKSNAGATSRSTRARRALTETRSPMTGKRQELQVS